MRRVTTIDFFYKFIFRMLVGIMGNKNREQDLNMSYLFL